MFNINKKKKHSWIFCVQWIILIHFKFNRKFISYVKIFFKYVKKKNVFTNFEWKFTEDFLLWRILFIQIKVVIIHPLVLYVKIEVVPLQLHHLELINPLQLPQRYIDIAVFTNIYINTYPSLTSSIHHSNDIHHPIYQQIANYFIAIYKAIINSIQF